MQVAESETMLTRCKMVLLAIGSTLSSGDIAANAMQRIARRSLARQATKARLHFHDTTQLRGTMEPFPCPALICLKPADNIRRRLHSARQRYVPFANQPSRLPWRQAAEIRCDVEDIRVAQRLGHGGHCLVGPAHADPICRQSPDQIIAILPRKAGNTRRCGRAPVLAMAGHANLGTLLASRDVHRLRARYRSSRRSHKNDAKNRNSFELAHLISHLFRSACCGCR